MTGRLKSPDLTRPTGPCNVHYLTPDGRLCRVYNRASGYGCFDWNTRVPSQKVGGRFDATRSDRFAYLYGSEAHDSARIAVIETLRPLFDYDPARKRDVVGSAEINSRALQYFHVSDGVSLANLRTQPARTALNVPEEVLYHGDRRLTREWGSYVRKHTGSDIGGLAYNSTQETVASGMASFVLWRDRLPGVRFVPASPEIGFDSSPGRRLLQGILDEYGVQIV